MSSSKRKFPPTPPPPPPPPPRPARPPERPRPVRPQVGLQQGPPPQQRRYYCAGHGFTEYSAKHGNSFELPCGKMTTAERPESSTFGLCEACDAAVKHADRPLLHWWWANHKAYANQAALQTPPRQPAPQTPPGQPAPQTPPGQPAPQCHQCRP